MSLASTAPLQSGSSNQTAPALAEPFEPKSQKAEKAATESTRGAIAEGGANKPEKKNKMRGLFGLGKKKIEEPVKAPSRSDPAANAAASSAGKQARSPPTRQSTTSPIQTPSSPGRGVSSSPRLASPAGSQIFERDVQEAAHVPNSPAIPSHIITENYVPPVLDDASQAITDDHLDPDSVEIITHSSHQPAAVAVTGVPDHLSNSWQDDLASSLAASDFRPVHDHTDSGSNYGSLDNVDIRRLSFISFADVVQAEHQGHAGLGGSRESIHLAGLTSLSSAGGGANRSPSPIRSPISSAGAASPPRSKTGSLRGIETSPSRKPLASPVSTNLSMSPSIPAIGLPGEINVETMSQALGRTGSDLNGMRSIPTSPVEGAPSR
jgi:hypothetical protein